MLHCCILLAYRPCCVIIRKGFVPAYAPQCLERGGCVQTVGMPFFFLLSLAVLAKESGSKAAAWFGNEQW